MKQLNLRNVISYIKNFSGTKNMFEYDGKLALSIQWANHFITDLEDLMNTATLPFEAPWYEVEGGDNVLTEYAKEIINRVAERYSYEIVLHSFCDLTEEEIEDGVFKFMDSFLNILNNTYEKYSKLLNLYSTADVTKGVYNHEEVSYSREDTGKGKSRFNDTPQNFDEDGETFDDIDHTTNLNLSESSFGVEGGSETTKENGKYDVMEKLDNISKMYENVLLSWSREFGRLFIFSTNYKKGCIQ